jgi:hypothetical protein
VDQRPTLSLALARRSLRRHSQGTARRRRDFRQPNPVSMVLRQGSVVHLSQAMACLRRGIRRSQDSLAGQGDARPKKGKVA